MIPLRALACLLVILPLAGCSKKHPAADVERGRKALQAALESWKNNEPADGLKSLSDPVEYTDELRLTHKLVDFTIDKANATDPEVIRYPVALKLQDRKGKSEERQVVYMVALKTPIVIARDPYE